MTLEDAPKRRPKDNEPRPHRVSSRFSDQERGLLTAASAATGLSPGAYVALAAIQTARNDAADTAGSVGEAWQAWYQTADPSNLLHTSPYDLMCEAFAAGWRARAQATGDDQSA